MRTQDMWGIIVVMGYIFLAIVHGVVVDRLVGKKLRPDQDLLPWVFGMVFPLTDAMALAFGLIVGAILLAIWIGEQITAGLQWMLKRKNTKKRRKEKRYG